MDMHDIVNLLEEVKKSGEKIDRSAFIYLSPQPGVKDHAQCSSCQFFLPEKERCGLFNNRFKVVADASCSLYVYGKPNDEQPIQDVVTPKEAGYVEGQVRCENCKWVEGKTCLLFDKLNKLMPYIFKLDTQIENKGCCNAWQEYKGT